MSQNVYKYKKDQNIVINAPEGFKFLEVYEIRNRANQTSGYKRNNDEDWRFEMKTGVADLNIDIDTGAITPIRSSIYPDMDNLSAITYLCYNINKQVFNQAAPSSDNVMILAGGYERNVDGAIFKDRTNIFTKLFDNSERVFID